MNRNRIPFRERLARFMMGRYGIDELYRLLLWVSVGLIVLNIFIGSWIISAAELLILIWATFRAMSRNIYKRRRENELYMKIASKISAPFKMMKNKWRDRKTHVYKKCPSCKSNLRLPKEKGEHTVRCPRCSNRFDIKIE